MRSTTIPFSGFYESWHSEEIDDVLVQLFDDEDGNPNWESYEDLCSTCEWSKVFLEYAKTYTKEFADLFDVKVAFMKVESPREYNFTTDRIIAAIELAEVRRLWKAVPKSILYEKSKERHTSYPGFHSFYDPEFVHNTPLPEWDMNMVGTLLEAWVQWKTEDGDVCEEWEREIMADARANGYVDSWIIDATPGFLDIEEHYSEQ